MNEKPMPSTQKAAVLSPLTITLIYVVVGGIYILFSDYLLASLVEDRETLTNLQTIKGWAYVLVTAVMLYLLIRSLAGQLQHLLLQVSESEQKYRDLADLLPEPIFETDMHGTLTYGNGKFLAAFGLGPDDLKKNTNVFDYVVTEQKSIASERFARIVHQENLGAYEYLLLRKSGGTFPSIVHTARIMRKGEVLGIRGVVVDITERKKLEEELNGYRQRLELVVAERTAQITQANEKLLKEIDERKKAEEGILLRATILDNAGEAIFLINSRGDFAYANEAAFKTYGYNGDEFLNMNLRQLLRQPDAPLMEARLKEVVDKGQLEMEAVHLHKDGSAMPVRVRHNLIKTPHGEFIVSVIRDLALDGQAKGKKTGFERRNS